MAFGFKKSSHTGGNSGQQALDRFSQMMIERMEKMKSSDWEKGWLNGVSNGMPRNISGRNYSGSNSFFLQLFSGAMGYKTPVFLTFRQANNFKAHVLKGASAFPVVYWDFLVKDKDGNKISPDVYRAMSRDEKAELDVIPFVKAFPVYNIDQTNFKDVQPEKYQKLLDEFKIKEFKDVNGMYENKAIDRMIEKQEWLCPIQADKPSNRAYYSPSQDMVVVPTKAQFNKGVAENMYSDGMEYYSTLLHEMTHSTMTPERLNRESGGRFGDEKYAKEELVAELSAAMIGNSMGFDSRITDNSAAYLDSWIGTLKKEPKFILSVMSDVNKASEMILNHVDKQRVALGETPYLSKNNPEAIAASEQLSHFKDAGIIKTKSGDYAVKASYDGVNMGFKPVDKETAMTFFKLNDHSEQQLFLAQTVRKNFDKEISSIDMNKKASLKLA